MGKAARTATGGGAIYGLGIFGALFYYCQAGRLVQMAYEGFGTLGASRRVAAR